MILLHDTAGNEIAIRAEIVAMMRDYAKGWS